MSKLVAFAIGLLLLSGAALTPAAAETETGTITVIGRGEVQVIPDMATITLGVTVQADTAEAATAEVAQSARDILTVLQGAGVATEDVQTSGLSLDPIYEPRRADLERAPRLLGFSADNTLRVIVRDLDGLGEVLDAVIDAGANTFRGLQFGLQDSVLAEEDARRDAVADAMAKAGLLAQEAGVTRGRIRSITEGGGNARRPEFAARMASDAGMPVAPGALNVSATVTMVFELDQ